MQQPMICLGFKSSPQLPVITLLGYLLYDPRPFGCPSTPVENFSAHFKCYLPQVFLESMHLSPNPPIMVLYSHLFDTVLTLQIAADIWLVVFSLPSGSEILDDQGLLPLFSESLAHATMVHSVGLPSNNHPSFLANKSSFIWKAYLWIMIDLRQSRKSESCPPNVLCFLCFPNSYWRCGKDSENFSPILKELFIFPLSLFLPLPSYCKRSCLEQWQP